MIQFKRFYAHNDLRNFSYLIYDEVTGDSWAIDPYDASPFVDYIKKQGLSLKGILNTHQHFDHIRGNAELVSRFKARVIGVERKLDLDSRNHLEFLEGPGHTSDHRVFLWKNSTNSPVLFSGDTLFNAGVGNCKNGGNVEELFTTVSKLKEHLSVDTILQPGHDYLKRNLEFALSVDPENKKISEYLREFQDDPLKRRPLTLAEEFEINPFLRVSDQSSFIKLRGMRDNW